MKAVVLFIVLFVSAALNAESLQIGTLTDDPPFEMSADSKAHFFGFDIDLMLEICSRLQVQCKFLPATFDQLFSRLLANQFDLSLGAINITADRERSYLFSLPYLPSYGQLMTTTDSQIKSINDLSGKKIGVVQGTAYEPVVSRQYNGQVEFVPYKTHPEILQALVNGEVDLVLANEKLLEYWVANNSNLKLIGNKILAGSGFGIMANKNGANIIENINRAMLQMESDGTYLKIYTRYFGEFDLR